MTNDAAASPELLLFIGDVLARHGADALGGATADAAAREWIAAGFADVEEIDDWLDAGCFNPRQAQRLESAGITPAQAALRTHAGRADYEETIAYKFSQGDLGLEEARRIITSDFWNS